MEGMIPRRRLIDLDRADFPGKSIMMRKLEEYERDHPVKQIIIEDGDGKRRVVLMED